VTPVPIYTPLPKTCQDPIQVLSRSSPTDKLINPLAQLDNMDKTPNGKKVKVQFDEDVVNKLLRMKKVGDSYSDFVRRLLRKKGMKRTKVEIAEEAM
jgi:hypothetical protein